MKATTPEASSVEAKIQAEIADHRERIAGIDKMIPAVQAEYEASLVALGRFSKNGHTSDAEHAAQATHDRIAREIGGLHDAKHRTEARIKLLSSPEELERRSQTSAKMAQVRKEYGMAKETPKEQGVPTVYLNEKGNFNIGKDARYKSDLVLSALGIISKTNPGDSLMQFEVKDAETRLKVRNWTKFLDRKREILAEADKAKADRAAEKEKATRERAEAKKVSDKAKADKKVAAKKEADQAKATTTTSGKSEDVKPDPK